MLMYEQACTTILVGKKASVDGSTMIARNDDTFMPITPQKFIVHPAVHGRHETLTSGKNGFTAHFQRMATVIKRYLILKLQKKGSLKKTGLMRKT